MGHSQKKECVYQRSLKVSFWADTSIALGEKETKANKIVQNLSFFFLLSLLPCQERE